MAVYAAVISLKRTINGLLNSSRISLVPSTRELLEFASNKTTSLQQVLERLNNSKSRSRSSYERLDGLDGQIRDSAHALEDALEFHELNPGEDEETALRQEMTLFGEIVKKMEKDYTDELSRDDDDDKADADAASASALSSWIDFGVEMVGHSNEFNLIKSNLIDTMRPDELTFYAFRGAHGSGKTAIPKIIFEDLGCNKQFFDCSAWVTVGTEHKQKDILIRIIAQVLDINIDYGLLVIQEDEELSKHVRRLLENRRYMIVLDDVKEVELVRYLRRSTTFPDKSNGSAVFITTTLGDVAGLADFEIPTDMSVEKGQQRVLWYIMRTMCFDEESLSTELELAGRKIIENCGRRIITFAKAMLFLLNSGSTLQQCRKLAADTQNPIFTVVDEISEISRIKKEMQHCGENITLCISAFVEFAIAVKNIKEIMYPERFFPKMQMISFYGMAGIGKTMFVRKIFKDELILSKFDHCVWITLGSEYQTENILIDILGQIYPDIHMKGDDKLVGHLSGQLFCKKWLIVLDNVCSKEPLLYLRNLYPNIRGTTLVTTRNAEVTKFGRDDILVPMDLLDEEESWCLLRQKVFGEGLCPGELENVGRKIAEKCDGLPLLILTVAEQLLKVEMSQDYWNNVAIGKEKLVFKNAHTQISEALLPSYLNLPQQIKPCFLYMGIFPEKFEIPVWNLVSLWISEGFLNPNSNQIEEDLSSDCLVGLVDDSLIMIKRMFDYFHIKTCRLHSVFWHLANTEAMKNEFFHAMTSYDNCSVQSLESQRRLCIRNNILLGMKYVQDSMAFNTSAHSLLCVGSLQQYQVPLNLNLRLLRVMNALTIRLYEFPTEVVRLVHLRYLGLMCNGNLPTSISNLWKLQYLIVKRYLNIKSSDNSLPLPMEIWEMKELKHLQVMGGYLRSPKYDTCLPKLSVVLDVSILSCTKEVFKVMPNLTRLGIRIEMAPADAGNSFQCLYNIYHLHSLESLKCVVVNPQIGSEVVALPVPFLMYPPGLKKLSLSGLGYPWKYMKLIGNLKKLEVLKLKHYAFQGPRWEMNYDDHLKNLKFLLVEDTNLVHWTAYDSLMHLERLSVKHCYKLQEHPMASDLALRKLDIVDCNPSTETWGNLMGMMMESCIVDVHNSWLCKPNKQE